MNINNKLTELIDGVNSGDIDTLADLQRELIYLRSEIQALRIHDVSGQSEQLCDFLEWYDESLTLEEREMEVKTYMDMKSHNCH